MASSWRVVRSVAVALLVAAPVVIAGCSGDGQASLTTTAIVRLPTGFHAARPTDDRVSTRLGARPLPVATELATLRLESAHRRAVVAAAAAVAASPAAGGFVCQIDMGSAPLD